MILLEDFNGVANMISGVQVYIFWHLEQHDELVALQHYRILRRSVLSACLLSALHTVLAVTLMAAIPRLAGLR